MGRAVGQTSAKNRVFIPENRGSRKGNLCYDHFFATSQYLSIANYYYYFSISDFPDLGFPDFDFPDFDFPDFDFPDFYFPDFDLPYFDFPDFDFPHFDFPRGAPSRSKPSAKSRNCLSQNWGHFWLKSIFREMPPERKSDRVLTGGEKFGPIF